MPAPRYPGLEIDEKLSLQRREWRVQRVAWVFLYALLAAIAFGLVGGGPLSKADAGSGQAGLRMEYERFLRYQAPNTLRLTLQSEAPTLELRLDSAYVQDVELRTISPRPQRVVAHDGFLSFEFLAQSGANIPVSIELHPEQIGPAAGWVAVGDKPKVHFRQFVYP